MITAWSKTTTGFLLLLPLLTACSDGSDSPAAFTPGIDTAAELQACSSGVLTDNSQVLANGWNLNNRSTRHQQAENAFITTENLDRLSLQWSFVFADEEERRGHPTVTSEAVILGSSNGTVRALGRSTGCLIWSFNAEAQVRSAILLEENTKDRNLFFGDTQALVYALDAATGAELWRTRVDPHPDAIITSSPLIDQGRLIIPISSLEVRSAADPGYDCCTFRGGVVALDSTTGAELWRYTTITQPQALDLRSGFTGPSGAPIWAAPTLDRERGLVFVGTGENYSRPSTQTSDAIIALDLETGEQRWLFQGTADDVWNIACLLPAPLNSNCPDNPGPDLDFGAAPVLVQRDGHSDLLIAAQKSGAIFALNPDNGALLWTQTLGFGGNLGGVHWGIATDNQRAYIPISDIQSRNLSFSDLGDLENASTIVATDGAMPGLYALDLDTGVIDWFTQPRRITPLNEDRPVILSAGITLANGLIYAAGLDGVLRVFDSENGRELAQRDTAIPVTGVNGISGNGGTIDSGGPVIAADMVYINSGYTTFGREPTWFAGPGNAFMAFGLNQAP